MQASSEFPLEVLPLVTVRTVEEAKRVAKGDFDVQVIYAAQFATCPCLRPSPTTTSGT